jgi:hypothetical protein
MHLRPSEIRTIIKGVALAIGVAVAYGEQVDGVVVSQKDSGSEISGESDSPAPSEDRAGLMMRAATGAPRSFGIRLTLYAADRTWLTPKRER